MSDVYFSIDKGADDVIQLSIDCDGAGYRICGPKYDGSSRTIKRHKLTANDVAEIRRYIRKVAQPFDRIDNDKGSVTLKDNGESLADIAERGGLDYSTVYTRFRNGFTGADLIRPLENTNRVALISSPLPGTREEVARIIYEKRRSKHLDAVPFRLLYSSAQQPYLEEAEAVLAHLAPLPPAPMPEREREALQAAYDFLQDKAFVPDSDTHRCTEIVEQLERALASHDDKRQISD